MQQSFLLDSENSQQVGRLVGSLLYSHNMGQQILDKFYGVQTYVHRVVRLWSLRIPTVIAAQLGYLYTEIGRKKEDRSG